MLVLAAVLMLGAVSWLCAGRTQGAAARCVRGGDWAPVLGAGAGCARVKTRRAVPRRFFRHKKGSWACFEAVANAGHSPETCCKFLLSGVYVGAMLCFPKECVLFLLVLV